MYTDINEWPIKKTLTSAIPDIAFKLNINTLVIDAPIIHIQRFSSYLKLISVTARILNAAKEHSILKLRESPLAKERENAVLFWIKELQKPLMDNFEKTFCKLGPSLDSQGIIIVGSRISNWIKDNWNANCFIS